MSSSSLVSSAQPRFLGIAVCAFALFIHPAALRAAESRYDHDIAVYDRLLAEARPGQEYIVCGDYGLTPAQVKIFRDRLVAARDASAAARKGGDPEPNFATPPNTTFKWTGGNVNYRFDATQVANNTITPAKMQEFRDGVGEWAAFANLHFIEFTGTPPTNYITVQEDPSRVGGFSSAIGMGGGQQMLLIGPTSWNRGTVCHEMGHALGLYHEQQRDNRDTYINLFPENYLPGADGNFTLIPGGTTMHGAYDFYSVMHYERNALSIDPPNKDTIEPRPAFIQYLNIIGRVGDRTLSKLDRAGMAEVYGNPSPLPSATITNTKDSGTGSLRAAIYYAFDKSTDAPPVPTALTFHIPTSDANYNASTGVFSIKPTYEITALGAGTTIDGATQTAFTGDTNTSGPEIMLDGSQWSASNLGLFAAGVVFRETNCVVRNLIISGFNADGIVFDGGTAATNGVIPSGNVVTGCYIGTDRTGTVGIGNGSGFPGIEMFGGPQGNTIGGTTAALRNVISGNTGHGIQMSDAGTTGNTIAGNYIGTTAAGTGVLSNGFTGVAVFGGAQNNIIGGTTAGTRNVISGNQNQGVLVADSGTTGNQVRGNYIGTNAAGTAALGNGQSGNWSGVAIVGGAQANVIGGTVAGAANVISGNTAQGLIIADTGSNSNLIQGNFIGTNPAGTTALPNNWSGIALFNGAQSNVIGGTTSAARNIVSGNNNQGVVLTDSGTNLNVIQGNYIGVNVTGTAALANAWAGVSIFGGAQLNLVGGSAPGTRNILSGNLNQGLTLSDAATASNLVQGNFIGLDVTGLVAIANAYSGIEVFGGSHSNTIGGIAVGARNYLSGNSGAGMTFSGIGTNLNTVQGNTIGLNVAGTAVPNTYQGIALYQAQQSDPSGPQFNLIGGSAAGASNLIAGNSFEGVALFDPGTLKNTVSGNSISANQFAGIGLYTNSNNNQATPSLSPAVLSSATNPDGTDVSGILNSVANTTFRIEFFANPGGTDEGKNFIGAANILTNGAGAAAFGPIHLIATVPIAPIQAGGSVITATATDSNGNTSPFSFPVNVTATDSDSDGIPDNWMTAHFGHTTGQVADKSRPSDDADGDGRTNLQEFRAGTDPKDATKRFGISSIVRAGSDVTVGFASVAGKTYRIDSKDDLSQATWTLVQDQVAATSATTSITDPGALGLTKRFYRITIEP